MPFFKKIKKFSHLGVFRSIFGGTLITDETKNVSKTRDTEEWPRRGAGY
jgi:hypothetical protein